MCLNSPDPYNNTCNLRQVELYFQPRASKEGAPKPAKILRRYVRISNCRAIGRAVIGGSFVVMMPFVAMRVGSPL
jgi:uncharacterized protein (DUF2062 family)